MANGCKTSLTPIKFFKLSQEVHKFYDTADGFWNNTACGRSLDWAEHFPLRYSLFPLRCALWCLATCWRFVSSGVPTLSATCGLWLFLSGPSCSSTLVSVRRRWRWAWAWRACSNTLVVFSYFYANSLFLPLGRFLQVLPGWVENEAKHCVFPKVREWSRFLVRDKALSWV